MLADNSQLLIDLEKKAISTLLSYMDLFKKFEEPIRNILRRRYTPEYLLETEGKQCVIRVSGLKYHDLTLFFQITGLSIKQVEPFETFDTYIQAPLSTMIQFFSRMLSGDDSAFGDMLASGSAKFMGKKTYHDAMIFEEACKGLAQNISRLRRV